jgi:hypothetical protein
MFMSLLQIMYAFSLPCLDCIMRWIDLFLVGGMIFKKVVSCGGLTCLISCLTDLKVPRHAVD